MKRKITTILLTGIVVMMMLCGSSVAYGGSGFEVVTLEENIKYLAPGIKETKRISLETGEMQHVDYACEIDLSKGTNEFFLGYREGELTTVSEQIADTEAKTGKNVVVGVNGCFYNMETAEPIGLLVSEGKVLYEATRGNTFFITREGEAKIMDIADICYDEKGNCTPVQDGQFQFAIGGSSMLLELDEETGEVKVIDGGDQDIKHSRTAVGVKADGTVVLFSTNGKMSPFNYGYTLTELGMVMKAKGCVQAMNLDGGGSVTYVSQHPGEKKDVRKTIGSDATQRNVCAGILVATTASEDGVFSKNEAKALQSSLSQCEQKGHDYVSTAKYVTCKTCGKRTPIKSFSGLATEKSSGGMQLLHKGKARTGYVPYDMFQVHYYNKKGISCEVELKKKKLPGCTDRGMLEFYCSKAPKGQQTYTYKFPKAIGHEYDVKKQKLVCRNCGWAAVDINDCRITIGNAGYSGEERRPTILVKTPDGKKLARKTPGLSGDYLRTFYNNVEIGTATIEFSPVVYYVNRMEPRSTIIGTRTIEYPILPYPATNLKGKDVSFDRLKLSWTPSASAGKDYVITYDVYVKRGKTWERIGSTTKSSYQVKGLAKGTDYTFGICATAVGKDGKTYESWEKAKKTISTAGCKVPSKIKASNVAKTGKVRLTWKEVKGADKYRIYRATSQNGKYKLVTTVKKTSYIHEIGTAGRLYYYKISAVKSDDKRWNSALSESVYRRCDLKRPVVELSTDRKSGKPKLTWKKVRGAEKYEIYRATKKNGKYTCLGTTTKAKYTDKKAKADKNYWYKVKAIDAKYSSAASALSPAKKRKM